MNYPSLPQNAIKLRAVPILSSEVQSLNTEEERCASHYEGQTIIVPGFIEGDRVDLVFSRHGNYAYVEDADLTVVTELNHVFHSEEEVWQKACFDAVEASGSENSIARLTGTIEISCAARQLIESREWWTPDTIREFVLGEIQSLMIPTAKVRSLFPGLFPLDSPKQAN